MTPPMSARLMRQIVTGSTGAIVRKCEQAEQAKYGREEEEMGRTPTPPQSGDEAAPRTPVGLLCGRRVAESRTDEQISLGCRADNDMTPHGRTSRRVSCHWNVSHKPNEGNHYEDND
jgi:hypothetical protein